MSGCVLPFGKLEHNCFALNTLKYMMQSQITETRVFPTQEEITGMLELGGAMNFNPSWPSDSSYFDFGLYHFPMASNPNIFELNPDSSNISNWLVPNGDSIFPDPNTTVHTHKDFSPIQETRFRKYSGEYGTSEWNDAEIFFSHSFSDASQNQTPSGRKDATKSLVDNCSDPIERRARISRISPSPLVAASGERCRKRSSSSDDKTEMDEFPRPIKCGRSYRESRASNLLACPFYKKNPQRHHICNKYTLRRIKDVKQHIYRHHCKPELYCPRCSQNFKCPSERDDHIRKGGCILKEVPNFDGIISENQRKRLKQYGSRGKSIEQQWMELWKLIFNGAKPPPSPYAEVDQSEVLSCLRSYWNNNADQIIARSMREEEVEFQGSILIRRIVDTILNHFETGSTDRDMSTGREKSGVSGQLLTSQN
ncbi:hypothetical protein F5Y09DRAFT_312862 [Xylaria sp. FL1042]|nr:hypothetical protein F5Y09DRAFT_312862 [Xylaria sp. FL1042]